MQLQENALLNNGKYQIVRKLGQGGYGITYLATTLEEVKGSMGTFPVRVPVAIKEFFVRAYSVRDLTTSDVLVPTAEGKEQVPNLMKDFIKEAETMSKMEHPNIVKVIEVFKEHQTIYYVMQYLEGSTLSDKVSGSGPLPVETAKKYIFQIGSAISYLHERKMCHYDVKPDNIMLPDDDKAVLIDFGITRRYDIQGNATTIRSVGYSSGYSSPEQILGDVQKFSPPSDIYSLAATLFFMVTGKSPSQDHKANAVVLAECQNIPDEIKSAISAGMQVDSSRRPQTVRDWLSMFEDQTVVRPKGGQSKGSTEGPKGGIGTSPGSTKGSKDPGNGGKKAPKPEPVPKKSEPVTFQWKSIVVVLILLLVVIGAVAFFVTSKTNKKSNVKSEVANMQWNKKNRYGNTYIYTGTVIDSIPNGHGRAEYSDGSSYEGNLKNGLRDDKNAIYIDKAGNKFSGSFSNDYIDSGRITAPDGRYYEGSFTDDKPFQGTWHEKNGDVLFYVKNGKLVTPN